MRLTLVSEFQGHLKIFLWTSRNISLLQTLVLLFQFFFVCDFATPGDICRRKVPNFSSALRPRRCFLMLPLFSTQPTISFVDVRISFVFPTLLGFFLSCDWCCWCLCYCQCYIRCHVWDDTGERNYLRGHCQCFCFIYSVDSTHISVIYCPKHNVWWCQGVLYMIGYSAINQ